MLASGHNAIGTTVGIIVAQNTQDPVLGVGIAFFLGIILHYLADGIPHGHLLDFDAFGKLPPTLFIDLFGSFCLFFGITLFKYSLSPTSLIVLAAIGGSQISDVLEGLAYFKKLPGIKLLRWENDLHQKIFHWHGYHRRALIWKWSRDSWQITVIVIALIFLLLG